MDKVFSDPQVVHLGIKISQEKMGQEIEIIGSPIKMHGMVKKFEPAALPGENTEDILTDILNLNEEAIERLRKEGVIL